MKKVMVFHIQSFVDTNLLEHLCQEIFSDYDLAMTSSQYGTLTILHDELSLVKTMQSFLEDQGYALTGVIGYKENQLLYVALDFIKTYHSNQVYALVDAMTLELLTQKYTIVNNMSEIFKQISFENIATAQAFIDHGCNAIKAADALYVHRNTFSYRLNKFIEQSQLDIRDFDNARLFKTWQVLQHNIK